LLTGKAELGQKQEIGKSKDSDQQNSDSRKWKDIWCDCGISRSYRTGKQLKAWRGQNAINILETILDYAYEGITVIDKNEKITYFNKANSTMLGLNQKMQLGKNLRSAA
jgi:transcriptional regulator with PAS, ATPase and Fis domain